MNNISLKQNEDSQLELLLAQRILYSGSKVYFSWRTTLALIFAILGPFFTTQNNNTGAYVGIASILYLLINTLLLEKIESSKKLTAAKIQELFDTRVLELEWNDTVAGPKPEPEEIASVLMNKSKDFTKLINWYSPDVSKVDLEFARFLCQRTNAWWENKLRNKYIGLLIGSLVFAITVLIILGLNLNLTISSFVLGMAVPVLPLIEIILRQIKDHFDSYFMIRDLKGRLDKTIEQILNGEAISNLKYLARTYQDEIFRYRHQCPAIFDWLYWLLRDRQEFQATYGISNKIAEYQKTAIRK